ncbi:MAG: hypothetical protein H8E35_03595 [Ardenticatenia bacterium]|nr:hypothetical protein [Ardenticatenia bacterium]
MKRSTGLTVTAVLMLLTAVGTILFWVTFFADLEAQRGGYLASRCDTWFAWEMSFPLADGWMAATAILGAVGLWRMRPAGLLFGLVSGGAMVFLGLMDVLFFLQNGLYFPLTGEVVVELFIHIWAVAFGLFAIACIWARRALLGR